MTDHFKNQSLPNGWEESQFKDIAAYIQRGKSPKYAVHSNFPVINQKCIRWHGIDLEFLKYLDPNESHKWSQERYLQPGDILWNSTGTGTIGRASIYKGNIENAVADSHVTIIRLPTHQILPEYVLYFIMSPYVQKNIESMQSGSTDQVELGKTVIEETKIPLPPFTEQKRIVSKIEKLFSEIDMGIENLLKAEELLKAYRQSLLKNAFEGNLTEKWRESEGKHIGSGKELLELILKERQQKWKDQKKYKDPLFLDEEGLSDLPDGWVWASLDQIMNASPQNGVYYPQTSYGQGVPILRIDDFQTNWIRPVEELQLVAVTNQDKELYALCDKDFILNRVNSLTHLGKTVCLSDNYSGVLFESNMMRFSISELISKEYLQYYLGSVAGRNCLIKNCKHAVNQASINQQDVRITAIPIPSKSEQDQLTKVLKDAFARSEELAKELKRGFAKAKYLRQSILKKAFSGELVSQNIHDEPASTLLEHIKAEKETKQPKKKQSKQLQKVAV